MLSPVSRETQSRLRALEELVSRWTPRINLVSSRSVHAIRHRHICDSAQLFQHAPHDAAHWVDLGAGGGFPGLVIAVLALEYRPSLHVTLVESDARKSAFLAHASREMALSCTVLTQRIEASSPRSADVVSARALAPLSRLLDMAQPWLGPKGVCLFLKGSKVDDELTEARKCWHMDLRRLPSASDARGCVLRVEDIRHAVES